MEYQTIISQSGTEHFVNPAPIASIGQRQGRIQTLCSFHVSPELSAVAASKKCDFCAKEAARIANMERK